MKQMSKDWWRRENDDRDDCDWSLSRSVVSMIVQCGWLRENKWNESITRVNGGRLTNRWQLYWLVKLLSNKQGTKVQESSINGIFKVVEWYQGHYGVKIESICILLGDSQTWCDTTLPLGRIDRFRVGQVREIDGWWLMAGSRGNWWMAMK